jgi:hypothetical protein
LFIRRLLQSFFPADNQTVSERFVRNHLRVKRSSRAFQHLEELRGEPADICERRAECKTGQRPGYLPQASSGTPAAP